MSVPVPTVAVIGLGYVGLPLAVAFGRKFPTVGYDLSEEKVAAYRRHADPSGEVSAEELRAASGLECTSDPRRIAEADFIVVAVPTPVDAAHNPDLGPLTHAAETAGRHMKSGATVVFESTVYPGATEEVCIPVLEKFSGMKWKTGFHVGYSPERINPGDREHTLARVVKVVAGDSPETLERVAALYGAVVEAGIHRTSSIMVAEAAKVIENTQRDLNIALMNELAIIFGKLGIDTTEVLEAAGTKWNFLRFRPGLVGGHCIGVDPYYLTYKAETLGYHPQVILAGRRINDGMGKHVAEKVVKLMARNGVAPGNATANVLGLTFKENCPDLRNSRVPDIVTELQSYGVKVRTHDPLAGKEEAMRQYGLALAEWDELPQADVLVIAVAHDAYRALGAAGLRAKVREGGSVADVKSIIPTGAFGAGIVHWRL